MRHLIFIITAFIISMVWSCSKEYQDIGTDKNLVHITAKVGDITTRATQEAGFQDGDSIMFYVTYNNDTADADIIYGVYKNNMVDVNIYAPYGNQVMDIVAFYPYNAITLENGEFNGLVNDTYFNNDPKSLIQDLLISKRTGILSYDTLIDLTFTHAMSVLKFNITEGEQYVNDLYILGDRLFKYNLLGDYLGTQDTNDTIFINSLCLIPAQNIKSMMVGLPGGGTVSAELDIDTEPGKITTVNLSVTPSQLIIYDTTILPWQDGILYDKGITL